MVFAFLGWTYWLVGGCCALEPVAAPSSCTKFAMAHTGEDEQKMEAEEPMKKCIKL